MDDKTIMENLLLTAKGACDLYMHGAIESATPNVHQAFSSALNSQLTMQDDIYQQMSRMGWYKTEQATPQQTQQIKQKFNPSC
ncbi:MAG: spore coat protein [Oscillospiraceae bacterium]